MSEFWGSWGRTSGTDRLLMGLERFNGFSLQDVKEDLRVITCLKTGR